MSSIKVYVEGEFDTYCSDVNSIIEIINAYCHNKETFTIYFNQESITLELQNVNSGRILKKEFFKAIHKETFCTINGDVLFKVLNVY